MMASTMKTTMSAMKMMSATTDADRTPTTRSSKGSRQQGTRWRLQGSHRKGRRGQEESERGLAVAKKDLDIGPLAVAVTVAIIGVLPLAWLLTRTDPAPPSQAAQAAPVAITQPASFAVPQPEVEAAGLHPSIVRVLESNGFAQATGRTELEELLAGPVLDVLIANGAVLTVPNGLDLTNVESAGGPE